MADLGEVRERIAATLEFTRSELSEMEVRVKTASLVSERSFWEDVAGCLDRLSSLADALSDLAVKVEEQDRNPGTVRFL